MTAYYNEFDPYAAQWLRNLIDAGLIPAGERPAADPCEKVALGVSAKFIGNHILD